MRVVLINIFGGITRCDDVATGLIEAFKELKTDMPIVIRLTGTNEKEGRELLKGTNFIVAETMAEAGKKSRCCCWILNANALKERPNIAFASYLTSSEQYIHNLKTS